MVIDAQALRDGAIPSNNFIERLVQGADAHVIGQPLRLWEIIQVDEGVIEQLMRYTTFDELGSQQVVCPGCAGSL